MVISTIGINSESDLFLRSTDQCPVYKSEYSSLATNRSVCGTYKYQWSFNQELPSPSPFEILVDGALTSRILAMNQILGIGHNQQYGVKIRSMHLDIQSTTEWGSSKCMRTIATAGIPLVSMDAIVEEKNCSIYPNPNSGEQFILKLEDDHVFQRFELIASSGQIIQKGNLDSGQTIFDMPHDISSGLYHVHLMGSNESLTLRLLIQK
jgi:hypothetical protein